MDGNDRIVSSNQFNKVYFFLGPSEPRKGRKGIDNGLRKHFKLYIKFSLKIQNLT